MWSCLVAYQALYDLQWHQVKDGKPVVRHHGMSASFLNQCDYCSYLAAVFLSVTFPRVWPKEL